MDVYVMYLINKFCPAKGRLVQAVRWPGGTPQVLSSTPRGSEFQAEVKKIPSPTPRCQSAVRPRLGSHRVTVPLRQDGGGGFLDLCEKIFFLREKPGAVIPLQVKFLYIYIYIYWFIYNILVSHKVFFLEIIRPLSSII